MVTHLRLITLQNILCMFHHDVIYKLSDLLFEFQFEFIGTFLVDEAFHTCLSYWIHVLDTHFLISLVQFEAELQNGLIFSHVSLKWHLLEYGVNHLWVVCRPSIWSQRHVLELHDSAAGGDDIVLSVSL